MESMTFERGTAIQKLIAANKEKIKMIDLMLERGSDFNIKINCQAYSKRGENAKQKRFLSTYFGEGDHIRPFLSSERDKLLSEIDSLQDKFNQL